MVGELMTLDLLPGPAQVAIQSGRYAANTIVRRLHGDTAERPFRYRDLGTMATVSRFRVIAGVGRVRVPGFPAWLMWLVVHLLALKASRAGRRCCSTGRSRSSAAGTRSARSPPQQVFADQAVAAQAAVIGTLDPHSPLRNGPLAS